MSVWLDKIGRCPDCGHRPFGQTNVRPKFWKFRWKSFIFESRVWTVLPCRLDGCTLAASNFHIKALRIWTKRMVVRTVDLMHAISIFDTRASGPWWLASGRLDLNCDTCLMDKRVRTGIHKHRGSSRRAESSGRMQAGAVWSFSTQRKVQKGTHVVRTDDALVWCESGRYNMSFGRLVLWTAGRPDGMTHHPDGWQGTKYYDLQTVQNILETLLNSGILIK
jgi:hypothetical protein